MTREPNNTSHPPGHAIPPRLRPAEPDHPMMLDGGVIGGDTQLQLRCLAEELLMCGYGPEHVEAMSRDPQYQALYAARCALGDETAGRILAEAAARLGRHTHRVWEETGTDQPATLTIGGREANHRDTETPRDGKVQSRAGKARVNGPEDGSSGLKAGFSAPDRFLGASVSRWFNPDLKRPEAPDIAGD
jgi:hypothetical protein